MYHPPRFLFAFGLNNVVVGVSTRKTTRNNFLAAECLKYAVIDKYMHCIVQNFKINAQGSRSKL